MALKTAPLAVQVRSNCLQDGPKTGPRRQHDGMFAQVDSKLPPRWRQEASRSQVDPNLAQLGAVLDSLKGPKPSKNQWFLKVFATSQFSVLRRPRRLQEDSKTAPRGPETAPRGPKRPPRGAKRGPRRPQDNPKTTPSRFQVAVQNDVMLASLHNLPRCAQDRPRTPPGRPKRPPKNPKRPQEAPKRLPRGPKRPPRSLQAAPNRPHLHHKNEQFM